MNTARPDKQKPEKRRATPLVPETPVSRRAPSLAGIALLVALPLAASFQVTSARDAGMSQGQGAQSPPGARSAGDDWQVLFDGSDLDAWRGYATGTVPEGWRMDGDTLHFAGGRGDIMTRESFGSFDLRLEWKISPGGNSGIFYRAVPGLEAIYMGAPEMQVLDDDAHEDGNDPLTSAGAVYGLYPAVPGLVKPAGEWNSVRIVVRGDEVAHWLNGQTVATYTLSSDDWIERVAVSKFSAWPLYGRARKGRIGLQDHGDPVWYRNIRIRSLD